MLRTATRIRWILSETLLHTVAPQVFLCYGKHSNLELLELYGFTMGHTVNPHDRAPLPLETLKTMAGPALDLREAECWVHAGGQPSWHLLATLRCAKVANLSSIGIVQQLLCRHAVVQLNGCNLCNGLGNHTAMCKPGGSHHRRQAGAVHD